MDEKLKNRITDNIIKYDIRDIDFDWQEQLGIKNNEYMICKRTLLFDLMTYEDIAVEQRKQVANENFYKAALENLKKQKMLNSEYTKKLEKK